ncbi:MAG: hypothetical protein RL769_81 [Pseudomonadota bacterium]|jgi:hypothetical protein
MLIFLKLFLEMDALLNQIIVLKLKNIFKIFLKKYASY